MIAEPRILVLMMYSGENEFAESKAILVRQSYQHHELVTIVNLPNRDAHHRLYQTIMDKAAEFDLFLKLDADMVLSSENALAQIMQVFGENPETDHVIFAVKDFIPDKLSFGLHAFSNRVKWDLSGEGLFVDPNPTYPGAKKIIWDEMPPLVIHAPNPLPYHAFHFGVHRALKAFQWDRMNAHPQAINMFKTLEATWEHFARTKDIRPGLAMIGAEMVRRKKLSASAANKKDAASLACYEVIKDISPEEIDQKLSPFWSNKIKRRIYWYGLVYPRIFPGAVLRRLKLQRPLR